MYHDLMSEHRKHTSKLVQAAFGLHLGPSRTIIVSHGRARGAQDGYTALLHHDDGIDLDDVFRRLRVRRVRKAIGREPLPDNGHWITVHPNGDEEEGHPVYIVPTNDGSHVIVGGAGGALNGMKLTHLKSPNEWKRHFEERRKQRKEAQAIAEEKLRNQLGAEAYAEHIANRDAEAAEKRHRVMAHEKALIETACRIQGIDPKQTELPASVFENLSPRAQQKLIDTNHRKWVDWASNVARRTKTVALANYADVMSSATGDVAISDFGQTGVGDTGTGYAGAVAQMAADAGLTTADIEAQQADVRWRSFLDRAAGDIDQARALEQKHEARIVSAKQSREEDEGAISRAAEVNAGPAAVAQMDTAPRAQNAQEMVKMLSALKQVQQARSDEKGRTDLEKEVDAAGRYGKGLMVYGPEVAEEHRAKFEAMVRSSIEDDARRKVMTEFVQVTDTIENQYGSMAQYYGVGATVTFNTIAQAVDGSMIDPVSVDILGTAGVAQVLAAKWRRAEPSGDFDKLKSGLVAHHIETQIQLLQSTAEQGAQLEQEINEMGDPPDPTDDDTMESALAHMAAKTELIKQMRQTIGVARGRIEAMGAINYAMAGNGKAPVRILLGEMGIDDAVERCAALGLTDPSRYGVAGNMEHEGQYTLHSDGPSKILELHDAGIRALAPPTNEVRAERAKRSAILKSGAEDEPDYLPAGISRRPTTSFEIEPLVRQSITAPLQVVNDDAPSSIRAKLEQYIGQRMADGADSLSVLSDIRSADIIAGMDLSPEAEARYRDEVESLMPTYWVWAQQQIDKSVQSGILPEDAEKLRQSYFDMKKQDFQKRWREHGRYLADKMEEWIPYTGDVVHRQVIPSNEQTQDAVYQCIMADPRAANGFLPPSQADKQSIRTWAKEHVLTDVRSEEERANPIYNDDGEEIMQSLSPVEHNVYREWQMLRKKTGATGMYNEMQRQMAEKHEQERSVSMFDDETPSSPSLFTCNLADDVAVVLAAKEHARKLGFSQVVNPSNNQMYVPELEASAGGDEEPLQSSPAQIARRAIKSYLKKAWIGEILGHAVVADSDFDPEDVQTFNKRWTAFCKDIGGPKVAVRAIQERMRGAVCERFASIYKAITGTQLVHNHVRMKDADAFALARMDPEAAKRLKARWQSRMADINREKNGQFGAGERREAAMNQMAAEEQMQVSLLQDEQKGEHIADVMVPTLGKAVHGTIARMLPYINTDGPVEVAGAITMSGEVAPRQRCSKMLSEFKRQGVNLGAGMGKTLILMGGYTNARAAGDAKRALFLVPSNIVAQFGSEFAKFRDPSVPLYWHADPGASGDKRRDALSNADLHAVVMTPESLRADVVKAVSEHLNINDKAAAEQLLSVPEEQVDDLVHEVCEKNGWNFDYVASDEGHRTLSRKGKEDALMARVADSLSRRAKYFAYSTADIAKNDPSEVWSALNKIAPDQYPPGSRDLFLRKYGRGTLSARLAMRQEMEPYIYAASMDVGVTSSHEQHVLTMSDNQRRDYAEVLNAYRRGRAALAQGNMQELRFAIETLSPAAFDDGEPSDEDLMRMGRSLSALKSTAENRVVNLHPESAKIEQAVKIMKDHPDDPTVIFAHNIESHQALVARMRSEGLKVGQIRGSMSSDAKEAARRAFQSGEVDVLICTDAGAVGANLQRGRRMIMYDTPNTAMLHKQRIARCVRAGRAEGDGHVTIHQLVTDCPYEVRARKRLENKAGLRDVWTEDVERLDDTGLAARIMRLREKQFEQSYSRPDEVRHAA